MVIILSRSTSPEFSIRQNNTIFSIDRIDIKCMYWNVFINLNETCIYINIKIKLFHVS